MTEQFGVNNHEAEMAIVDTKHYEITMNPDGTETRVEVPAPTDAQPQVEAN